MWTIHRNLTIILPITYHLSATNGGVRKALYRQNYYLYNSLVCKLLARIRLICKNLLILVVLQIFPMSNLKSNSEDFANLFGNKRISLICTSSYHITVYQSITIHKSKPEVISTLTGVHV